MIEVFYNYGKHIQLITLRAIGFKIYLSRVNKLFAYGILCIVCVPGSAKVRKGFRIHWDWSYR